MKKTKVLHYGLSGSMGGIETYLLRIASLINKDNYEFHFLVAKGENSCFNSELRSIGCFFHEITPRKKSFFENRRDLDKLFSSEKFDIFHMHLNTLSYVAPIEYAQKYGAVCVIHSRSSGASSFRVRIFHYLNRALLRNKGITKIAVSQQAGDWLFGYSAEFDVLPNGVDVSKYAFDEELRAQGRAELSLSDECLVLGHVGAFLPVKNHEFLLEVAEELSNKNIDFALILIGSGPDLENIKAVAKEKGISSSLKFLGIREDLEKLYSIMDVFILPSKFEGFGNVVLEAQASGLPCVISNAVINDLALSDQCQLVSLDKGAAAWAKHILEIKRVINSQRKAAMTGLEFSSFSVDSEIARLESLYQRMLGEHNIKCSSF